MSKRKQPSPEFKAKVALAARKGEHMVAGSGFIRRSVIPPDLKAIQK